jgi:hypothetical protein
MTNPASGHATATGAVTARSRDAAFVIHLTDVGAEPGDQAHGRVEHVTTGRATRFDSVDELMLFMRQTLAAVDGGGS